MLVFFKVIWAFVPFIREMLFPGKTNAQVISQNKFAFSLLLLLVLSFSFNWVMIERIYSIALDRKGGSGVALSSPTKAASSPLPNETASSPPPPTPEESDEKARQDMRERLNSLFAK